MAIQCALALHIHHTDTHTHAQELWFDLIYEWSMFNQIVFFCRLATANRPTFGVVHSVALRKF